MGACRMSDKSPEPESQRAREPESQRVRESESQRVRVREPESQSQQPEPAVRTSSQQSAPAPWTRWSPMQELFEVRMLDPTLLDPTLLAPGFPSIVAWKTSGRAVTLAQNVEKIFSP